MFKYYGWKGTLEEAEAPKLEFGYPSAVPTSASAAWGARAIVTSGRWPDLEALPRLDFLHDRQSLCWKDEDGKEELTNRLNDGILERIQEKYGELRENEQITDSSANEVVLYEGKRVKAVGNTNASGGYMYIAAWLIN
jgi:hypothetical protein